MLCDHVYNMYNTYFLHFCALILYQELRYNSFIGLIAHRFIFIPKITYQKYKMYVCVMLRNE